jgi:hypothetical protein
MIEKKAAAPTDTAPDDQHARPAEEAVTAARQARGYHAATGEGQEKFICDYDLFETFSEAVMLDHLTAIGK